MARIICFVCGSQGAEHRLRIKPYENEPYFPFLEHHDPPKGSRLPSEDGIVDSCRVCNAFLCQQWETYERSHTPAIKRLYWLKRADNGHFTGAEMRLQGEYIAQIMGLQYQPGSFDGRTSPHDIGQDMRPSSARLDRKSIESGKERKTQQFSHSLAQQKVAPVTRTSVNVPLYNSVNRGIITPKAHQMPEGALDLSVTKKSDNAIKGNDKNESLLCFLCAQRVHLLESNLVNSLRQPNSEPYFPVVQNLPCLPGAVPLNEVGQARVCMPCKNSLFQQWQAYEMSGIPTQHRNYKIYESQELKILRSTAVAPQRMQHIDLSQTSSEHICYICGHIYPTELIRSLFTIPSNDPSMGTLFFPFVRDLSRPAGAEPLRSDGSVLACRNCYEALYKQWQLQEMERIPLPQRQYTLSFLGKKGDVIDTSYKIKQMKQEPEEISNTEREPKSSKSGLSIPLNIQISENSQETNNVGASEGLLAIASSSSSVNEEILIPKAKSPFKSNSSPSVDLIGKSIPHPLQQATEIPQKICFLCGEKCRLSKAHVLCSYPTRHEAKTLNSQVVPFFPFLANRDPAPRADPMTEDGTVISCNVCFHILIQQWNEYEENKTGDSNRWLRKYTLPEFVCCLCSNWMKHKNIQLISSKTFPFLKDIKPTTAAPTIEDGNTVGVCISCANSLIQQNVEYEKMGVPPELRKFNWMKQGEQTVQEEDVCVDEEDDKFSKQQEKIEEYSKETNSSTQGISEDSAGSGQNVKPPPLNMLSGSKLPRNTATVPPLNQTSPSNGLNSNSSNAALNATRTSSFAAALRKLAHQAKDPEDSPKHGSQPGSSTTSPRATTPKRGPPPLVYTSHSSLSSPPVVTIAPTQSHASIVSKDSRQSIDRTHTVQSTSSAYDSLTSVKLDRPHSRQSGREEERYRPLSSHSSRDDDRLSSKEATIARRTPLSAQSSTSPAVTREETLMRGFQPYRPGDDLRHSLPPFGLDSAAYPYPAFLPPHAFPHPAFRFDDPLLLERYRMMQPHYLPFAHPGMLPPPGGLNPFLTGRYPPELLHQQLPYMSQSSRLSDHLSPSIVERQRLEEERMRDLEKEQREKEKEAILLREKERAREREKEYDKLRESMSHDYRSHHSTELRVPHHVDSRTSGVDLRTPQLSAESKKSETKDRNHNERGPYNSDSIPRSVEGHKYGSITHGTPRDFNLNEKSSRELQFNTDSERHKSVRRDIESSKHGHHDASKHHSHHEKHGSVADHKDKKYSLLHSGHHSDKNKTKCESESKFHKSSDSIFRPFDTSNLTNGYLQSHRSRDVTGSSMQNAERTIETSQGRLPKDNTDNKSSALKYSVAMPTKSGSFNLNHVIDASKMHYKEFHSEHLQSNFEKNRNLVISRLDVGEQKLRERRQRGELSDDSEMDEIIDYLDESHKQNLLMVIKGPPLQLDASKEKTKFLKRLGLTSQRVKRDLEYKKIRRRRRRHREPSVSPILMVDGEEKPISQSHKLDPQVLCQEPDYPNKCSFLGSFSLGTVENEKKKGSAMKRKQDRKSEDHSGKKVPRTNRTEKVKLFPNKNGEKTLSQEFAQEFHNSVLQSTQQKQINGRLGLNSEQTGESSITSKTLISQDSLPDKIPKWPGIDILMESYQKYQEDFKMEKTMLKDRCRNLQTSNQDLNKKAEDLSRKMSDSIEKKKLQEESRLKNQGAIASLKQILKDMK